MCRCRRPGFDLHRARGLSKTARGLAKGTCHGFAAYLGAQSQSGVSVVELAVSYFRAILTCMMFLAAWVGASRHTAAADPWSEVGATDRPKWVAASTERRLRLVPALPAVKGNLQTQATTYFGLQGPGLSV